MGEVHDELKGFVTERFEGEDHVVDQQVTIRFPNLQKEFDPVLQVNVTMIFTQDFFIPQVNSQWPLLFNVIRVEKNNLSHFFLYLVSSCDVVEDRVASLRCSSLNKIRSLDTG